MVTIWFKHKKISHCMSIEVDMNIGGIALATEVWDNLAKEFEMVSARP
jgi:hypothetical protein